MKIADTNTSLRKRRRRKQLVELAALCAVAAVVSASAIVTKEATGTRALASLAAVDAPADVEAQQQAQSHAELDGVPGDNLWAAQMPTYMPAPIAEPVVAPVAMPEPKVEIISEEIKDAYPSGTKFFNGRPVRAARTITMVVTAYSPDSRSCGDSADGITSSIHNVYTNGMKLVAADSKILPLGSIISVPGYDNDNVVPVLDRGGAIKGNRLDLLYPTHESALKWGVKKLKVTVWEYADGKPADDYRVFRDAKH